jgi:hypothetical protein
MEQDVLADPRLWLAGAIYFLALYFAMGTSLWLAAAVGASVMLCWAFGFGRHWIMNIGTGLMLIAFAITAGWLPHPQNWSAAIFQVLHQSV